MTGELQISRNTDGAVTVEATPSVVQMSLGLVVALAADGVMSMRDGLLVLTGSDEPDVVYRVVDMKTTEYPAANEGGWLFCELVR